MTFEEWLQKSIYGLPLHQKLGAGRVYTSEEVESAMEAAWQAGMKEQYRRDQYAQQQHSRITNNK